MTMGILLGDLSEVYRVLKGFERTENLRFGNEVASGVRSSKRGKAPFPIGAMAVAWRRAHQSLGDAQAYEAAIIGFWFLLRASEFLPPSSSSSRSTRDLPDSSSSLTVGCVKFYRAGAEVITSRRADAVGVVVRNSKAKRGRHCEIRFPALQDKSLCPLSILARRVEGKSISDLVFPDVTRSRLVAFLNSCVAGMNPRPINSSFNIHSLRKGGASAFSLVGLPETYINAHGRWGERVVDLYACFPGSVLGKAAEAICRLIKSST